MRKIVLIALALAVATGCVGKGKYKDLEASLAAEQEGRATDVAARDASIAELERFLEQAEARYGELAAEHEAMQKEVERLRAEKAAAVADSAALKASVAEMEQALAELAARKAAAEKAVRAYHDLVARFQSLIDAGKLQVKIVDGRMVVELATDVLFGSGSATLSTEGESAVEEVGRVLAGIPDRRYQVEGHTDNVPIKSDRFPSNWELASARSLVVVRELVAAGVPAGNVSGASFADTRPVASNDTAEGKSANRRIEIVVVPDLSQLPGMEELEAAAAAAPVPAAPAPAAPAPAAPAPTP